MDMKIASPRSSSTYLAAVIGLLLAAVPVRAQDSAPLGAAAVPPAREGNIYDHRDHQPTQAEIDAAEAAAGAHPAREPSQTQVEDEVKALLKQTDEADKRSDADLKNGSSNGR
jgi:hypothetical protein